MNYDGVFKKTLILALAVHTIIVVLIIKQTAFKSEPLRILAVVDFAYYDPLGGNPGGGKSNTVSSSPEPDSSSAKIEDIVKPEVVQTDDCKISQNIQEDTVETIVQSKELSTVEEIERIASDETLPGVEPGGILEGVLTAGGGMGDGAGGTGDGEGYGNSDILSAYIAQIYNELEKKKKYPSAAYARKLEGVTTLFFTVDKNGKIIDYNITESSGYSVLDNEAKVLMKKVVLPEMPYELITTLSQASIDLTFSIEFKVP